MAARAMWKGIIRFGEIRVPVKLYSAIEDRDVHFRMLHDKDKHPVRQAMVNPETDEIVPYQETRRAFRADNGDLVILESEDLDSLEPEASRDIELLYFLPQQHIDHRWYDRPYYLGPDGSMADYAALALALQESGQDGLARWVMRKKEYIGALRLYEGYPMLMSLRHAEEVVPVESLDAPSGKPLDKKELAMARQLIGMLEAEFTPGEYRDEYRERVLDMIEKKAKGRSVKIVPMQKRRAPEDIAGALEASLRSARSA